MNTQTKAHEAHLAYLRELAKQLPFELLGVNQFYFFYRMPGGKVKALHAHDHTRHGIWSLFGRRTDVLRKLWPSPGGGDWDEEAASGDLFGAVSMKGIVDPAKFGFEWDWGPPEGDEVVLARTDEFTARVPDCERGLDALLSMMKMPDGEPDDA